MDIQKFFEAITGPVFPQLAQSQKDGITAILDGCQKYGVTDQRMQAYILATAWWEADRTMQPIEERGHGAGYPYGKKLKQAKDKLGNHIPYETPDFIYYGRGHCQSTWYENYEMLSEQQFAKEKGWDFLNHPELLLTMEPSVWAMIHCMWHGAYTGVSLLKFFNSSTCDWFNARKIINGLDQAATIAGAAQHIYGAMQISKTVTT